ncbi:putative MFS-type transporter YhjX [compost metagenome]
MSASAPFHPGSAPWYTQAWVLVLAGGIVMGLALGVRHVQGLFLLPITLERGWSREVFGLAMAVQNLTWGVFQPFSGMLADRFGSARVVLGGLLFYALGLFCMTHAATPMAFVLSAGICIGIALSGTAFGVVYGALSRLVAEDRRSWALGMAGAVGGLGQFAMVPAAQEMIGGMGWSSALVVLSVLMAFALPLAFPLREPAQQKQQGTSGTMEMPMREAIREAFNHPGFWLLNLGFLSCGFQLAFVATHLPAYLLDQGMQVSDGVAALAIIALTNVAGIYWCGLLGGWYRRKYLLAGLYLARSGAMALFVLLPLSPWSLYPFAAAMGFLWLGAVPLTTGLLSQVFGVRYIGTLFGFVFLGHQLGSFLGVWLGGHVFDATGSYELIWLIAMALGVMSAALHWPIDDREILRAAPATASA